MATPDIYETPLSRRSRMNYASGELVREWIVRYTDDHATARALVAAAAPLAYAGLERKSIELNPLGAPDLWTALVEYGAATPSGCFRRDQDTFRAVSGTAHITQSKQTLFRLKAGDVIPAGTNLTTGALLADRFTPDGYTPVPSDVGLQVVVTGGTDWVTGSYTITGVSGGAWVVTGPAMTAGVPGGVWYLSGGGGAPDCKGAIGQTNDTLAGCEIIVPRLEFTIAAARGSVDDAFLRLVRSMVGTTNNATYRGYPAGTLLYMGCEPTSGEGTLADASAFKAWNLAHSFAHEPDVFNVNVGGIVIPKKGGWEYLWAKYKPKPDRGGLAIQPEAIYLERVYDSSDFTLLGIPA